MSAEHAVVVVRIGDVEKHANADTLSITRVFGGYPVIFRTGDFATGDLAIYVPVDSVVPPVGKFAFLADPKMPEKPVRIRAKKLRGVFSMGLIVPAGLHVEGTVVGPTYEIHPYEPPEDLTTGGDNEHDPGFMPVYTDIEGLRRYRDVLTPDEEVVATEKIHGASGRFVWQDGRLWVGSRTGIKREDPKSIWWKASEWAGLADKLKRVPGIAIYGEVYGQVQDLKYGVASGVRFAAFDALRTADRKYLDYDEFALTVDGLGIPKVPLLYRGSFGGLADALAEGRTVLGAGVCVREGFVVRPVHERFDERCGRVILKLAGESYHLRKSAS